MSRVEVPLRFPDDVNGHFPKFGSGRVFAQHEAAKAALDLGVPTYRFLRRYLERRVPAPLTLRQVDPLIRQLTLYRDLIDCKTGDPL